jgi:hypothetical protein
MNFIWIDGPSLALSNDENPSSIAISNRELFEKWRLASLKKSDNNNLGF